MSIVLDEACWGNDITRLALPGGDGGKARWRADGAGRPRFFDIGVEEKAEILKCQNSERAWRGVATETRPITVNYGGKLFSAAVRALAIRGGKDGANKPKST